MSDMTEASDQEREIVKKEKFQSEASVRDYKSEDKQEIAKTGSNEKIEYTELKPPAEKEERRSKEGMVKEELREGVE